MGTNYYWLKDVCDHCGRAERVHIGKSSGGWCFALHVYPDCDLPKDWIGWKDALKPKPMAVGMEKERITDEYGVDVPFDSLVRVVEERCGNLSDERDYRGILLAYGSEERFHAENHSMRGPNGLIRRQIDGRHCIGHGEGTWDYCVGEFS